MKNLMRNQAIEKHRAPLQAAWRGLAVALVAAAPVLSPVPVLGAEELFGLCAGTPQVSCVIDGDTIIHRGERIRMIDFDAPEIETPRCASEEELGQKARLRVHDLLDGATVRIVKSGNRNEDRYGRKLRLVTVNGRSLGDILIEEGLAWPWEGRRHDWCRGTR
jgi:endonuclease YncB( thermonuclease family)